VALCISSSAKEITTVTQRAGAGENRQCMLTYFAELKIFQNQGKALVTHTCYPGYLEGRVREILSTKYPTQKGAGGAAHVVEHLPSKCEALSSICSAAKKKKNSKSKVQLSSAAWRPRTILRRSFINEHMSSW
jgi:hypothetical protein